MRKFFSPKIQGSLRHVLTSVGPVLAMNGTASESDWQVGVGVIMAVIGFVGSWVAPEKQ